jgi:hypothetical protein
MPLSEFDQQARLLPDGRVQVSGTTELERDEQGNDVPRKAPVHFHFLVVQGGIVVSGRTQTLEEVWTGSTTASRDLRPGPAQAGGLAIITREGPPPAFETFTWFQELLLDTGTPSPPP